VVNATSTHYELDKPYYYPGDGGRLLLVTKNDDPEDLYIFQAEMNITGIGTFTWNGTGLPEATNLPPTVHAYLLRSGQTANIEILFRIPADARPGEYEYTWSITSSHSPFAGSPIIHSDRLRVIAAGEKPPSESQFNPLLLVFIAPLILLAVYPMARRRGKKTAKPPAASGGTVSTCRKCGRDLSQFPDDITNCPYCGKDISIQEVTPIEVKGMKAEFPEGTERIRRYAKRVALLGLLMAVASFVLGPFLGGLMGSEQTYMFPMLHEYQNDIGNGVIVGILIAIASVLLRAVAGTFKRRGGEELG
jgi:DNA-directed RNA polymerase subunit RPC12/RpoP